MNRDLALQAQADDLQALYWRVDFPILDSQVHGHPLVYLDNAATTHKPRPVIEAESRFYLHDNSNVHRGIHALSQRATEQYEAARARVQRFINAASPEEIVFVRGTTEAINLVAQSYGRSRLQVGDEILLSELEHHSNIVPWQLLCQQTGAELRVIPVDDAGELRMEALRELLGPRTALLALTHVSNALGTINPVAEIVALAHAQGVPVLLDGAQAVAHLAVDVQALDCDFYAFSGHKLYGPMGIGVLYGKASHLKAMPPWQGGGDMIRAVSFAYTDYAAPPARFEAGTPNVAGAIGLAAAMDYVSAIGIDEIAAHEHALLRYASELLQGIPGLRLIGTAQDKSAILSFVMDGVHAHDIGTILDARGVAIRTGHHCAMPLMQRFGVPATARASFGLYNTHREVGALADGLLQVAEMFHE